MLCVEVQNLLVEDVAKDGLRDPSAGRENSNTVKPHDAKKT